MFGFGSKKKEVVLDRPGSLHLHVTDYDKFSITDLVVSGELNGDDLALLREMAGYRGTGGKSLGSLSRLDLKNARFVPGGKAYARSPRGECFIEEEGNIPVRAFRKCEKLKVVVLPEGIKTVGAHAFERCTALSSITMQEGLETIGVRAFRKCYSLKVLNFPPTVTLIDNEAFSEDEKIKKIYMMPFNPPTAYVNSFYGVDTAEVKLFIPESTLESYKKNMSWKKFRKIKEE